MSLSLNTESKPYGFLCTFKDGRKAGLITRCKDAWYAMPIASGHDKGFQSLEAAEFYILAFAAEHNATRTKESAQ